MAGPVAATYKDAEGSKIEGLAEEFRFYDLRHYSASLVIPEGADVKVVQARLRHASAKTTLDTYAHPWPDTEESTRPPPKGARDSRGLFMDYGHPEAP